MGVVTRTCDSRHRATGVALEHGLEIGGFDRES